MLSKGLAATLLARSALGQLGARRRRRPTSRSAWERWASEPRSLVLLILFSVLFIGGGRKLLKALRARRAVERLGEPKVTPEDIISAAGHGRDGSMELFRILGTGETEAQRLAAGQALAWLWSRDELIAEEEKALARRGFQVTWKARRRYPRDLQTPIPIVIAYGLPFLNDDGPGISPANLEWSHKIAGARRARLEVDSPWIAGHPVASFELIPNDFETNGPHRLVLQARVRTVGLTESWDLELPHMPFSFEFDPLLAVDALLASPDEARAATFAESVRLVPVDADFLPINEGLAIRGIPRLNVREPLPCDLAHDLSIEFEGIPGRFAAGSITVQGQGQGGWGQPSRTLEFPIGPVATVPTETLGNPGIKRIRAWLTPDPDRGWADPEVRSIWPGLLETNTIEVEVVRR